MIKALHNLLSWVRRRLCRYYVTIDDRDNSVTPSAPLLRRMLHGANGDQADIYVFRVGRSYAFAVNTPLHVDYEPQVSTLQYNSHYHCIGFAPLCPTVNKIYYDYGLPLGNPYKLHVRRRRCAAVRYYQITNHILT